VTIGATSNNPRNPSASAMSARRAHGPSPVRLRPRPCPGRGAVAMEDGSAHASALRAHRSSKLMAKRSRNEAPSITEAIAVAPA